MKKLTKRFLALMLVLAVTFTGIIISSPDQVSAAASGKKIVVSIGDSYSSGEGIEPFFGQDKASAEKVEDEDWLAHRSEKVWSSMLEIDGQKMVHDDNWFFAAASGAETTDLYNQQMKSYNYDGLNIEHKRSKPFIELFSNSEREALNNFRKEYINLQNLKKPTDIIIFTDSYSFSATSTLIKGFQNIGGAITVGYFGNPKLEGINLFDASQSDSGVLSLSDEYKLGKMKLDIGITNTEIFNDLYQGGNPIPREYQLNPVDYRVDIYSKYSDELYDEFIKEGLEIHKKFNQENYCNSKNKKLIFHDNNNCNEIVGNNYAHGGYICGDDNKWDKTKCVPYYCDIGYSLNLYDGKCEEECKSNSKAFYLHENTFSKKYNINKDEMYEFITMNSDNVYWFKSSEDNLYVSNKKIPRIYFAKGSHDHVLINEFQNTKNDFQLEINSFKSNIEFEHYNEKSLDQEEYLYIKEKFMFITQFEKNHILYLDFYKKSKTKILYAKYKNEINYEDIIKGDNKYFETCSNKIIYLEQNEIYIIYLIFSEPTWIHVNFEPKEQDNTIQLNGNSQNFIYLQKGRKYKLDYKNMRMKTMIKLSKQTINSEINITDKNIQINSTNYYYEVENDVEKQNGMLELEVTKEDAFIEVLYKEEYNEDYDILDFEQKSFQLNKTYNFISIPKKYATSTIDFDIQANINSNYSISLGYSLNEYNHIPIFDKDDMIQLNDYKFQITEPYDDKDEFMEEEYFTIMIILLKGNINLKIQIKEKEKSNNDNDESKNLPDWAIALIVVGSVIVLLIIIFLIWRACGGCCH